MPKNPFTTWTAADVAQHNARVTGKMRQDEPVQPVAEPSHVGAPPTLLAEDRLNQTEKRYLAKLRERNCYDSIRIHPMKLRLASHRCYYEPDFLTVFNSKLFTFHETKGAHIWEDGMIKLKTAAAQFPEFQFVLAQWKNGQWTETVIRA